jgi:hypothetical protein
MRTRTLIAVVLLASAVSSCRRDAHVPCCVDVLDLIPFASVRPVVHPPDAVRVAAVTVGGSEQRALSVIVPSRVSIRAQVPAHAVLSTAWAVSAPADREAGTGVAFSIGISDGRTYETLMERTILASDQASWQPVHVDLRRYAGWQWSLFYRPSAIAWEIVFNSYPAGPPREQGRAFWAVPAITGMAR